MEQFPQTVVGGVSISRLICGTNWFMGFSHTSAAKDRFIKEQFDTPDKIAKVIEVFARNGCNAVMGPMNDMLQKAICIVQQQVGEKIHWVVTPGGPDTAKGDAWKRVVDEAKAREATFCFPHQCVTDPRVDRINNCLTDDLKENLRYVRSAGLIPGLSTHMPEAIPCSDSCGADVETYVQPYNSAGFMMQVEADWVTRVIHEAKKPVMTIKPLAAGRILPPVGLAFVWATLRPIDMVTIGTLSTYEAEESIEISRAFIEGRESDVKLQFTRSKAALMAAK